MEEVMPDPITSAVLITRLHEEVAQLRRDLGIYEEALENVAYGPDFGDPSVAMRALKEVTEIDTTAEEDRGVDSFA